MNHLPGGINRTIPRKKEVRDLIFCLRQQVSFLGKCSKINGRHHAFRSVMSSETRSTTSKVEF